LGAAFVVTLVHPGAWALGLAGFLAGGGLALVAWPIVVLPTPTGLQNALGTPASTLVLGTPTGTMVLLAASAVAAVLALLAAALLAGAWAERAGILLAVGAAEEEGLIGREITGTVDAGTGGGITSGAGRATGVLGGRPLPGAGRVALLRAASLVPVIVVFALCWPQLYSTTYRELILPAELVTPLPFRVIRAVPLALAALALAWLVADAAAAAGVRRLVLERRSLPTAWALGWADVLRRPHRWLGTQLVGLAGLVLVATPPLVAAALGWGRVQDALIGGAGPVASVAVVLLWVAIWLGGLVLTGVGTAFRANASTMEALARR
jgi:hypothetical protein